MTLFDYSGFSEIKDPGWSYSTLRPPLGFREVLLDIKMHWTRYSKDRLSFSKRVKFMVLRVFQRIGYNIGWVLATTKYRKRWAGVK